MATHDDLDTRTERSPGRPGPAPRASDQTGQAGGADDQSGRASLPQAGHRSGRLGRSPFGSTAPSIALALVYAVVAVVWMTMGQSWAPGRWIPVHLFTLGVLTNLVLVFSEHFGRTLTRQPELDIRWQPVVLNLGVIALLAGLPMEQRWLVATGATVVTAVVFVSYWRLRRMRKAAVGARFTWIVRVYERAHGAFIHGAILGALMGVGVLQGAWYGSARTAHLHINILGWGGLTLLATLVFFGPTLMRTRIVPGADERAARALRHGATGLTIAVLLLLATGLGGTSATVLRLLAAAAMAVFAVATTVTCVPVGEAAQRAKPSATRWPVMALSTWFPAVVWVDVVVIATGQWRFLDALGLAVILGVLVQAIATVLTYLAPMLRGRSFAGRDIVIARLETGARLRTTAFNVGVFALVLAAALRGDAGAAGAVLARGGWALIVAALAHQLVAGARPVRRPDPDAPATSSVARRYRDTP